MTETNPDVAIQYRGLKIPSSPFLDETIINLIEQDNYESWEMDGALSVVQPEDRILEMGAGLGIVSGVVALENKPEAILSFEANPNLIPHIRRLHALNGLSDRIEVRNAILSANPKDPDSIPFHIDASYLGSSVFDNEGESTTSVRVAKADFEAVKREFAPTVLVMDIEGAELDFLRNADLSGIRAIVIEFHRLIYGHKGVRACKRILSNAGFLRLDDLSWRVVWTCTRDLG
ncbi:FkbM family methyltransferase (plasmid) [Ruegeria sp. SCSIO 43209]|uniref:FkbM family methyltransferase n=1 Tax=Ruegeria sp. SCSIO 43209 TaxID=2793010 RepID=UPI00147C12F0|nr:FkbM family methyltransferase [Ruegeria sp. SCSIO 43209]UAB91418.1 FkbM family methyltransferase [Ruegeria sp. SCSIO 43209]